MNSVYILPVYKKVAVSYQWHKRLGKLETIILKMSLHVAVVCTVAVLSCLVLHSQAVNPGFRTIITKKGLDYANQVGFPILKEVLDNLTVPDISGSADVGIISVDYTVSNIKFKRLDFGSPSLTSGPTGLSLTDNGISMVLSAGWSYRENGWPHIKDSGSVDISAGGISLSVSVMALANKTDGHLELNSTGCSFTIGDINIVFHGGASWLYNLFSGTIEDLLRNELTKQVCSLATEEINSLGNMAVGSLPVVIPVGDKVEISYALVSDPDFNHTGRIITDHRGEFLLIANPHQRPPFSPPKLPEPSSDIFDDSKMVYILATTYVADSASFAFWKAGYMNYNVSNDKLPSIFKKTSGYCTLVSKELCKKYPDNDIMFGISASKFPRVNITAKYAAMYGQAYASMYVLTNDSVELAFTLAVNIQADVRPFLRQSGPEYFICGNISNPRVNISLEKSNIGNFDCSALQDVIKAILPTLGLTYLNNYGNAGFPIPMVDGVSLVQPELKFGEGYVVVGSDVSYQMEYLKKLRGIVR